MMTIEEAKKKIAAQNSKCSISKQCDYDKWFIFVLKSKNNAIMDPLSVDKKTGKIEVFNPIVVGGEKFSAAMKLLK